VPALTKSLRREYTLLYGSCFVRPARKAVVDSVARGLAANKARYQKVGDGLGVPWYVIAVIHSLEAGGDFTRHLHNGDPLTARTVHVPAGRPVKGNPPFTWEQSATDALRLRGLGAWKDWSVPGTLYQLEGYNGFGYRDHHPNVPSPYLWSFSNHYTRGKYVADGRFTATAVSQQVGAAPLLKQLVASAQNRRVAIPTGPRILQLANPRVKGFDVLEAQ
jgi:lysozyme family protein